ncbi:hypothetical protein [Sulfolobus acidocaldarius]|nr:hypothetical protein [Sulfolobus acidocaldarius]AGE70400.1 hypothetical protein SacN8_02095 [Sulfolobus acidocaldarius N8]AGE72674.1 hypothetical protein SacRon12I_02090 [Sulfolobus acidocaldarius Ron12/I]AHC50910.1 hypothetical protein SUSAZ_02155 [Sulfolobus acidocaldarius SUSAZ]WCM35990.1 hypothetical protein GO597_03105 [Sulfolobus acidocaldarius DSM 639]ALU29208.1 hypothetical protein ATY89_04165 [Sulfolobus acidocaldarius]
MEIPENVKKELKDGVCVACCDNIVICMSEDLPTNPNADTDLEVDREGGEIIIRHIIKDNPDNPLYLEYPADRKFVENVSKANGSVKIFFVDQKFNEKSTFIVKLNKEDLRLLRREIGLGP